MLAVPNNQNDTGKPMANAAERACDIPRCQPMAAAETPTKVENNMANEECMPCSTKKMNTYQAAPQTPRAVKGQRIRFDN